MPLMARGQKMVIVLTCLPTLQAIAKGKKRFVLHISKDGYNYRALNSDKPIISSEKISSTGGVRDPHILRGADGKTFYMVATDMVSALGWSSNRAMVLLKSTDLVNWTSSSR